MLVLVFASPPWYHRAAGKASPKSQEGKHHEKRSRRRAGGLPHARADRGGIRRRRQGQRHERGVGHDLQQRPHRPVHRRGPQDHAEHLKDPGVHRQPCRPRAHGRGGLFRHRHRQQNGGQVRAHRLPCGKERARQRPDHRGISRGDGVRIGGGEPDGELLRHRRQDRQHRRRGARTLRKRQGRPQKAGRPHLRPVPAWLLRNRRTGRQGLERRRGADKK